MVDAEGLLPAMTREEKVLDTVGTVVGLVPLLGGPVSSILLGLSGDRRFDRVRVCLVELAERVGELNEEQEAFVRSEDFEDLLIETMQRVWVERSEEKRHAYRDILLDAIAHPTAEPYDERLRFLRILEQVQEAHIQVLRATTQDRDPNDSHVGRMEHLLLERLGWDDQADLGLLRDLVEQMADLRLVDANQLDAVSKAPGHNETRHLLTSLGQRFVRFLEANQ